MKLLPCFVACLCFVYLLCCSALTAEELTPHQLIGKTIEKLGINKTKGKLLSVKLMDSNVQNFQSDRTYEPFFSAISSSDLWFDSENNIQRTHSVMVYPGFGPATKPSVMLATPRATFFVRDTVKVQVSNQSGPDRELNPWSVLLDWRAATGIRREKNVVYRDYPRTVLVRTTGEGEERLFLDPKTDFPVKLDRSEKHYLWGQIHVEYVYSNWKDVEDGFYPSTSFRLDDGKTVISRTAGTIELISRDSVTVSLQPGTIAENFDNSLMFLRPLPPDTIRIPESNSFLLKNRGYTESVTMIDGTIYVFDATQGEQRARLDEERIKTLYPGKHPVVVVVTDLAWPHVAGVRYWVSQGATVVSHRMSKEFLKSIIDRKWTLEPDELEKKRARVRFKFIPVDSTSSFANGKLRLYAIDGIGSEGALLAYVPGEKFVWASDYIQDITAPSPYAMEVWNRVRQAGLSPEFVAAEHIPLTKWSVIDSLFAGGGTPAGNEKK